MHACTNWATALCVQERAAVNLAVVLVQASWAAALAEPSAFLATARRVLEEDLARVRAEATARGWLGPSLPSGVHQAVHEQAYKRHSVAVVVAVEVRLNTSNSPIRLNNLVGRAGRLQSIP